MAGGTKVADVYVDLGLALTEYRKGLAQAKTEAGSIGAQIRSALSMPAGGTGTYSSGFARVIQDIKSGQPALAAFRANLPAVARDLAKLTAAGLTSSLNALGSVGTRVFGGLRSLASNVFKGIAVGAGITAFLGVEQVVARLVSAFPELINKGREYAEAIHTITLETGATSEAASTQAGIYRYLGGSTEQYATQVVRLAARIKGLAEETLVKYHIALKDANHDSLDTVQIVENMRAVFSKLPDGPDKTRIAFQLFGQRGAQAFGPLIHFLGLTDDQVKLLGADVEKQGLVITDVQAKIADETEKAQNRVGNAITGVATALFTAVGPQLTAFFDGLAETITANGQQIVDTLGSMATAVLGFVEGLLGVPAALNSFSTQFPRIDEGGANTSATLIRLNTELDTLKNKLNPASDAASKLNAGIDAQTKALDKEGEAIDRQIAKLKKIGDAQDIQFRRGLDALTRTLDLETQLLDAEDKAAGRADQDLAQTRALREAKIALFEAQAQLRKDTLEPDADAAKAQSQRDKDALDIAKAQQDVLDAQKAITDEATSRGRDDRRTQLSGVREYVTSIQKIVEDSENQKAALTTLTKRKAKLEDEIAAATEKGNAQEVADLKVKLAAVDQGITQETAKIKNTAAVDELTARKTQLADMKKALQDEKTSEASINRAATATAIKLKEDEIAAEKKRIAQAIASKAREISDIGLMEHAITGDGGKGGLVGAYEDARLKGIKMADDVRKALVGEDGTGGILGAIGSIASAIGHIFDGLTKAWDAIPKELRGVVLGAVAGFVAGGPVGAVAGAIGGGAIQLNAVNAENDAQRQAVIDQTKDFAKNATLVDLQKTWSMLGDARAKAKTMFGTETIESAFLAQLVDILAKAIADRFALTVTPQHAAGGWVGTHGAELGMFGEQGPEYVLDNDLSKRLQRFLSAGEVGGRPEPRMQKDRERDFWQWLQSPSGLLGMVAEWFGSETGGRRVDHPDAHRKGYIPPFDPRDERPGRGAYGDDRPGRALGGWADYGMYRLGEKGREYVADHSLSEKLDAFFSGPRAPAMATAGADAFSGQPVHLHFEVGGKEFLDFIDRRLGFRSGR